MARTDKGHPKTRTVLGQTTGNVTAALLRRERQEGLRRLSSWKLGQERLDILKHGYEAQRDAIAKQMADRFDLAYDSYLHGFGKNTRTARPSSAEALRRIGRTGGFEGRAARLQGLSDFVEQNVSNLDSSLKGIAKAGPARETIKRATTNRAVAPVAFPGAPDVERSLSRARSDVRKALKLRRELPSVTSRLRQARALQDEATASLAAYNEKASGLFDKIRSVATQKRAALESRMDAGARMIREAAGPRASGLQRFLVDPMSSVRARLGSARDAWQRGRDALASALKAPTVATKTKAAEALAAVADKGFAAKAGVHLANVPMRVIGSAPEAVARTVRGVVVKPLGFAKNVVVKPISGLFNTIETVGSAMAGDGTGRFANFVRGSTKATGLAGGFAAGSWIDAGLSYAKFKAEGGDVSDLGKDERLKVGGRDVVLKGATFKDAVLSRKFAGEAARGLLRQLTFGIAGGSEYEWENGGDVSAAEQDRRARMGLDIRTGEALVDSQGEDVSGAIAAQSIKLDNEAQRKKDIAAYFAQFDPKGVPAGALRDSPTGGYKGNAVRGARWLGLQNPAANDVVGYMRAVADLGRSKDARLEALRQSFVTWGEHGNEFQKKTYSRFGGDVERYMKTATTQLDTEYQKRLSHMLASDLAQRASDYNRRAAYLTLTGRDYDVDTSARLTDDTAQTYADFNRAWTSMDTVSRVTFDREQFQKDFDADVAAFDNALKQKEVTSGK